MFNLQGSEIIVILLLALVILGPEKLPDAIRRFSQTYAELKKMGTGFQSELRSALDEPMREMRETAELVRDAADPQRLVEQAEAEAAVQAVADDVPIDARAFAIDDPAVEAASGGAAPDRVAPAPINQIAAANSSAALAEAAADAEAEAAAEVASDDVAPATDTTVDNPRVDGAAVAPQEVPVRDANEEANAS